MGIDATRPYCLKCMENCEVLVRVRNFKRRFRSKCCKAKVWMSKAAK